MRDSGAIIAGKYRLEASIGVGGMGAVWRATHVELGRSVAVKFVLGDTPPDESIARFLREARSAAAVRHRNVVDVLDFGRDEAGAPYLVMEYLEGESLDERIKRAPKPTLSEIAEWVAGALGGLAAIHDANIVHRDLKPGNVFLARDADGIVVKVLDFGIARPTDPSTATLTHSMQTLGTPHYMSPEQVRSAKIVDARADLYSMGVILYQALSGRLPFEGPSATAIIAAIVTDEPTPLQSLVSDLPPALVEVVHRAMARDPAARFPDARAMRRALLESIGGAVTGPSSLAPGLDVATTMPMGPSPLVGSTPRAREIQAPPPPPESSSFPGEEGGRRSGRRGFFALFAAFSSVAVIGLAALAGGTMMLNGSAPDAAAPPPGAPPVATTPAAPAEPTPEILTPALPLAGLARRYRELAADTRPCVRFAPVGEAWAAVTASGCAERAASLQSALLRAGEAPAPPEDTSLSDLREPRILRTTVSSNYRAGPGVAHDLVGTLAERTMLVGISDPEGAPAEEGRSPWIRIAAADEAVGWMAERLTAPWEGCVPSVAELGGTSALASRVRVPLEGGVVDGLVVVNGDVIRVSEADATCHLETIAETRVAGRVIDDWFLTSTEDDAGIALLVVGARARSAGPDAAVQWRALRVEQALGSVWSVELHTSQRLLETRRDLIGGPFRRGPERREGYWPLRIRRGGRAQPREYYVWDAARETLVLDRGGVDDAPEDTVSSAEDAVTLAGDDTAAGDEAPAAE